MKKKRVLLKLSGESLGNKEGSGLDKKAIQTILKGILDLVHHGHEVGIVIGGGNIFRGKEGKDLHLGRTVADEMGMLATIINAIALKEALQKENIPTLIMSAILAGSMTEEISVEKAKAHLKKGGIVIFAGGTGNPFFTTDTAATLRAAEIEADVIMKATKVDGVYSKDPKKYKDAKRYAKISYSKALEEKLEVMDATSFALAMTAGIPIIVFNMAEEKFSKVLANPKLGTIVE